MKRKLLPFLLASVMMAAPLYTANAEELTDGSTIELSPESAEQAEGVKTQESSETAEREILCPDQSARVYFTVTGEGPVRTECDSPDAVIKSKGYSKIQTGDYVQYKYEYEVSFAKEGSYKVAFIHDESKTTFDYLAEVKAHEFEKGKTIESTCKSEGFTEYICKNCGKTEKRDIIQAKPHEWEKEYVTDKEPACEEKGQKSIHCSVCDTIKKESIQEIPALGHKYKTEIQKASFEKDGSMKTTCTVCKKEKENKVIPHVEEVSLFEKEYSYNGTNRKPEVVLRDKDDRIIPTECYQVTYPGESKKPGTYTLAVTLKGDSYEGNKIEEYKIVKGNQTISLSDMEKRIDSKTVTLKAKIIQGNKTGKFSYKSDNPDVASVTSWGKVTFHKVGEVKITAYTKESGNYNGASRTITLTVTPKPTVVTKLQSEKKGCLNIRYRGEKDVDGYQIQCSTSADMKGAKSYSVKNPAVSSYSRTDMKSGSRCYVRVRTFKNTNGERIYSNWSGVKNIKIK